MNKVIEIGTLTRDSELKYSQNGKAICTFSIAVNEFIKGEKTVQFFNIVSFGAENLSAYLVKGTKVGIVGKLSNSSYEKDGQKIYKTEIIADSFGGIELLSKKQSDNEDLITVSDNGELPWD